MLSTRWDNCGLRWAPWAAVLTVILCRELALPGKAKSIRPFTRCSAGTEQGHSHRPGRRPRSPEGRAAAALGIPGVTYLPTFRGPPGIKTPSLPLPTHCSGTGSMGDCVASPRAASEMFLPVVGRFSHPAISSPALHPFLLVWSICNFPLSEPQPPPTTCKGKEHAGCYEAIAGIQGRGRGTSQDSPGRRGWGPGPGRQQGRW